MAKKTTAINPYNVAVNQQSGRVGNVRYYQKGLKTYVRSAHNSYTNNPRTPKQMLVRLLLVCKVLLWKTLKDYLYEAFQGTSPSVSTFNRFIAVNKNKGVYLPKGSKDCILYPYTVSEGDLPPIVCTITEGQSTVFSSDIVLGESASVATIGAISMAILANDTDERFKMGDKITFLLLEQINVSGRPSRVQVVSYQFTIDPADTTEQSDFVLSTAKNLAVSVSTTTDRMLAAAYIHSRLIDGDNGFAVSTQSLVCNSDCNYSDYTTDDAFEVAANSYGERKIIYLRP